MALRGSLIRLAERADVQPALKKMWKKHYKIDGRVTQHLSPFEQNVVSPMMKTLPEKVAEKARNFLLEAGAGLGFGLFVYWWADWKYSDLAYHHRV